MYDKTKLSELVQFSGIHAGVTVIDVAAVATSLNPVPWARNHP